MRLQLQGRRPAEEGRPALGRRAQSRPYGEDAETGRQRPAARRTDQRSRHRNARGARRSARKFRGLRRSEEHTYELQSLMRISYAVFCLKKKKKKTKL